MSGGVKEVSAQYQISRHSREGGNLVEAEACPVGYKQTDVGVIPEDWDVEPIKESFEICNTLRLPISRTIREGMQGVYPYYGPTKIQDYINEYRVEGEYALIGEDGDHFLKYENMPQTQLAKGRFNVNNHAHLIKGKKNLTEWFYFFFRNRDISLYLTRQGAGRFKLSKGSLENLPCALPPVHEQKEIVLVLSDVDALIISLEKLVAKKRAIKTATMQQLLTGKKRLTGFSDDWVDITLSHFGQCHRGVSYKPDTDLFEYDTDNSIRLLRSNNVQNRLIKLNNIQYVISNRVSDVQVLRKNDILVCMANGSKELVGKAGRFTVDDEYQYTYGAFMGCFRPAMNKCDSSFTFYLFQTNQFRNHIGVILAGSSINNLTPGNVESFSTKVPSDINEQREISKVLSDMDLEIKKLEKRLTKTQQLKQGMMQELLTGKTRLI